MRLTDQDAAFLYQETASSPMQGCMLTVLDGELSFEEFYAHIESRLHLVPRYRQRLAFVPFNLAHPRWVDDPDFNLDNHIKRHRLDPGATLEDAFSAALELNEPLLPRDRPLWLTYVIEGVPGRTVLAQQAHHAMIDGASGIDVSLLLFDLQPNPSPPAPPTEPWNPSPMPTALELTQEAMQDNLQELARENPFATAERLQKQGALVQRGVESINRFVSEPAITAPWNAGQLGPKRNFRWQTYSFADFRRVRRAFGGTINDVVLAMVTESAARYLEAHDELVGNGKLCVMCPVNVRREGETGVVGNRVSGVFPRFPAKPMPIVERLESVKTIMSRIKENQEAQAMELLQESGPGTAPIAMAQTLLVGTPFDPTAFAAQNPAPVPPRTRPRPPLIGVNFTCTNVPGVQMPQYLAGRQVLGTWGLLMLGGNLGYGVSVLSYNQQLHFNFMCEPRLMPDLDLMASGVRDAFDELLEAADERTPIASDA